MGRVRMSALAIISGAAWATGGVVGGWDGGSGMLAWSQALDPAVERAAQAPIAAPAALEEDFATDQGDLFLLERRKFFRLFGDADLVATNNAFFSDQNRRSDEYLALRAGLDVSTVIDGAVEIGLRGEYRDVRFNDFDELDSHVWRAETRAAATVEGFDLAAVLAFDRIQDGDWAVILDQASLSGVVGRRVAIGDGLLTLQAIGSRYASDPGDYAQYRGDLSAGYLHPLTQAVYASATLSATGRVYDGYFSGVFAEDRRDLTGRARLKLGYAPAPGFEISAAVEAARNESTLDPLDYEAFSGSGALSGSIRF